jgi:hypothetical protein
MQKTHRWVRVDARRSMFGKDSLPMCRPVPLDFAQKRYFLLHGYVPCSRHLVYNY